ncbi:Hypothetical protein R9X50_00220000 [Acrodontium crateriforme]|uniref:Uncharacterized protein n=1 Tax=Acrodontium crateriforme TaxID=150365 RepID=A0AAQ3M6I5_9PEZI|nr:Hypothetical protein R9X50_00220000 [Acrodontium crateriforme]
MFFKRLSRSRSRSNSQSYVDSYPSPHDSKANSQNYDDKFAPSVDNHTTQALPPSRQPNSTVHGKTLADPDTTMYARPHQPADAPGYSSLPPTRAGAMSNGYPAGGYDGVSSPIKSSEPAPDLLTQAFNQALRPHLDKVETLESEIADLRAYIDQLESQRADVHAWIDKRGLRPDVPPSIAHQMDQGSHNSGPSHAAVTLNAQLDRKITIVNFDLHRLQDDLNDSLPTPSFSACMLKFLPDISRLAALPSGPRYAFDLLLKLGGNLNSHGGLENGDEEDLRERRSFYNRLDGAMVDVVRGRFRDEGEGWGVQREIKRIEKTGAYLRNWGVEPYFPRTLEVMRDSTTGPAGKPTSADEHVPAGGSAEPPNYN